MGAGGHAAGDTLIGIENLKCSDHDDTLIGDTGANMLSGCAGTDSLVGDAGADTLFGGVGDDELEGCAGADSLEGGSSGYSIGRHRLWVLRRRSSGHRLVPRFRWRGMAVNLATGMGAGGYAEGDTLIGIEDLEGSDLDDTLIGDASVDDLTGRAGADSLVGGAGNDTSLRRRGRVHRLVPKLRCRGGR